MDPVRVGTPFFGYRHRPEQINVKQSEKQVKAKCKQEEEEVGLQVCAQAGRVDAWSVFKGLCHQHAWGLEGDNDDFLRPSGMVSFCI